MSAETYQPVGLVDYFVTKSCVVEFQNFVGLPNHTMTRHCPHPSPAAADKGHVLTTPLQKVMVCASFVTPLSELLVESIVGGCGRAWASPAALPH